MRILHYSLGFPPLRRGGLVKYTLDLMLEQAKDAKNEVALLYPSGTHLFSNSYFVRPVSKPEGCVDVFRLGNTPLIPLFYGISDPYLILNQKKIGRSFRELYENLRPDIFHIHTLMGLPMSLLDFLKEKGVKLIFTSHDYFGLCLKVNFINHSGVFCTHRGSNACAVCNANAPGRLFLLLRNSRFLAPLKKYNFFHTRGQALAKRKTYSEKKQITPAVFSGYEKLLRYYQDMLGQIDYFHFNSSVAREMYEQYLTPPFSSVLSITHSGISDHREYRDYPAKLRMGFIGDASPYKGFPLLKNTLSELENKEDWQLDAWGMGILNTNDERIRCRGLFTADQLAGVFGEMDVLIVPSIWKETFGLVVLEALSYGVPVIVSEQVGAKDVVKKYDESFVYHSENELKALLDELIGSKERLRNYNRRINELPWEYALADHVAEMNRLYNELLSI